MRWCVRQVQVSATSRLDYVRIKQELFLSTFNCCFIVSKGDWLGNPANIKVENNGALGYVGAPVTVLNPLFLSQTMTE